LRVEVVGIYVGAIERAEWSRSIVKAEMLARVLGITRLEMLVDAPMGEQGQKGAPSLQL
jgi:ribosome-binding protein aMBF1 (putative translation factor)